MKALDDNPYNIISPVTGSQFIGQEELLRSIMLALTSSNNSVTIFGRARFGKTSMLREISIRLRNWGYIPIYWELKDKIDLPIQSTLQALMQVIVQTLEIPVADLQPWQDISDFYPIFLLQRHE